MRQPLAFFCIILFIVVGLTMLFTNYRNPSAQLNKLLSSEHIDECYDETLTTWFVEFNANQNAGITMAAADKVASAKAVSEYEQCLNQ